MTGLKRMVLCTLAVVCGLAAMLAIVWGCSWIYVEVLPDDERYGFARFATALVIAILLFGLAYHLVFSWLDQLTIWADEGAEREVDRLRRENRELRMKLEKLK